jgi:hypothetical protein
METIRRHMREKSDVVSILLIALSVVVAYSAFGAYLLR